RSDKVKEGVGYNDVPPPGTDLYLSPKKDLSWTGLPEFVLKKCFIDEPLAIPLDEIQIDGKLNLIEEPVEIIDREVKWLKQSRIPIVKIRWNSRQGLEFIWEREDQMLKKFMEFPLSKEVPTASEGSSHCQKKRDPTAVKIRTATKVKQTVTLTTDDMKKRKNDVKARTTLLLSLHDEHQLRFSKYKTAQELWAAILKTFGGNEATKKTKKNLLKQYLAPEWLMHTIVWRNRGDLDTMSIDDLYNNLKVYESEVQKKSEPNSQNMAFISSAKHNNRNEEVNIASGSTAIINVSTASANIRVANISQDTACAYIASQSSGSQIKFKDINHIDEDDMEEMDIKWNMALLSMKADRQGSKVEERAPKALMAIDGVGWDWSYMANDDENHALVANEEASSEFDLMAKTSAKSEVFDNSLCSKSWLAQVEARLAEHRNQELKYCEKIRILEFKTESRANCIDSLTKDLELLKKEKGYSGVPHPPAQVYSPPKKDMSWTGLPEFKDDTVTDYSRPSPAIESTKDAARQEVKKDASSLRYIALPKWIHEVQLESSSSQPQDTCNYDEPKSSGNSHSHYILGVTTNLEESNGVEADNVWTLVNCPKRVRPIGTKWVLKNKKDERGIVIKNKARLVAQGHTQEERIDYDEVFEPVARIEAIRLFLAYASFMRFTVYQMDVKSVSLYGTIDEEVYVMQPPRF
nr:copia protein [Tanacetum cinerariifolium]